MSSGAPIYPLKDVNDLAKAGKVGFSKQAQLDFAALGYTLEQAKECIAWICASEFHNVRDYGPKLRFDAYITRHKGPDGVDRDIYVKLKIPHPSTVDQVYVTSFHPPVFP